MADPAIDEVEAIAGAIAALAPLAPSAVAWFKSILSASSEPLAQRVADILPEESESRRVQHELGG